MLVKKMISLFFIAMSFVLFFATGCSNGNVEYIVLDEELIKKDYLIGENIEIESLKLLVKEKESNEKEYIITENMFTLSDINTKILGKQNLKIIVNYEGENLEFNLDINYSIPDEVNEIIFAINTLPLLENLNVEDKLKINAIVDKYNSLNDLHKEYVSNHEDLKEKLEYVIQLEKIDIKNIEIEERRKKCINALNELVDSLNEKDYTKENWDEIMRLYSLGIDQLKVDSNYNIMNSIVEIINSSILNVETNENIYIKNLKEIAVNKLNELKQSYNKELYTDIRYAEFNVILINSIQKINNANSKKEIDYIYNETCKSFNNILTIEKEKEMLLNNAIVTKINEITEYYLSINLNFYDTESKAELNKYLNNCIELIKNSNDVDEVNKYVDLYKLIMNNVLTIEEKEINRFNEYIYAVVGEINEIYENIDIYSYDTDTINKINKDLEESILLVKCSKTYNEVDCVKENFINKINVYLTIEEISIIELENNKNKYLLELESFTSKFKKDSYSVNKWNDILRINEETKEYIANLTIFDKKSEITNYLNNSYLLIENVLTLDEEQEILLADAIKNAIIELEEYYDSLNKDNYNDSAWVFITNKMNNVKNTIYSLVEVESISKLVEDTINSIKLI